LPGAPAARARKHTPDRHRSPANPRTTALVQCPQHRLRAQGSRPGPVSAGNRLSSRQTRRPAAARRGHAQHPLPAFSQAAGPRRRRWPPRHRHGGDPGGPHLTGRGSSRPAATTPASFPAARPSQVMSKSTRWPMSAMSSVSSTLRGEKTCSANLAACERIVCVGSSNACFTGQLRSARTCALHVF
jgi:hypothetical protein